ncbi:poly(A) RNA polymerase gld-2 homolog B isoform X1 [Anastrepha ludens]|uniref:poly(A) RNA polymerase gld-2 homolog B isoform X1 n=1 Tax=Anastrepha ludens TaxID=28586 RepID=UPI0023B028A7|nr:poly(A) RNA polymerase gld-2 homolog B isoform X1 [Anastrepha ludens]XP_053948282.1 poly(A) RNA polymerase gld-2 homolog B isoform X1 [Anastrepha ludens]XP_053948283.1 poly(A) RNA polymerase gld-2 homolog B isoform X1 [Anastrepha ludens]XP_053948284.1 poly(A) RNA polymerase gld-2 homolog B isoform X1 [Anastrepha ludens]
MVAGNMKIITLTNVSTAKTQHHNNNVLTTTSPNSITNTTKTQQAASNANKSPKMRYYKGNIYNNDSVKSLQTPKHCASNNKNGKKSHSHMLYNIPTTSVLSSKKYYQQHHRYNQQQQNNKDIRNNNALKNHVLEFDTSSPVDILPCVQNQKIPIIGSNNLVSVEDLVNNNTSKLDANSIYKPTNNDANCAGLIVDNSIALSSHRAKSEFKQRTPSTSPKIAAPILLASSTITAANPSGQHNCLGENTSINLDCNSCWTNLVTPQCSESQTLLSWPWVHVSRRKSVSVSSTSSYSSSTSVSSTASNSELLQNTNVKYANNTTDIIHTKKKPFRKGNINNIRVPKTEKRPSPHIKGPHQRRTFNVSTTANDPQDIKCSIASCADNQKNSYSAEDASPKKTAMATVLPSSTVSSPTAITTTVDPKVKTTIAEDDTENSEESISTAETLTVTTPFSTSVNEINAIGEFQTPSVSPATTSTSTVTSKTLDNTSSTVTLATPPTSSTTSTQGSTFSNSYSLDFLHSVGEQMTGGANLSPHCKSNTNDMRTTVFNSQNPVVVSPVRNVYYQNSLPQRPHIMHERYVPNSSGFGFNSNSSTTGVHTRDQRGHRFQQHHHHPQRLTIGSFMQKELLNEGFIGSGSSSSNGNNGINGSGDSGSVDVNNNNGEHRNNQRRNYYPSHYQQRVSKAQHEYASVQSSYNNEIGNNGVSRTSRNGSSTPLQQSKQYMYQNHQNNVGATSNSYQNRGVVEETDSGGGSGNVSGGNESNGTNETISNNVRLSKQSQQKLSSAKKSSGISSATSSCSSSSASSNSSQASTTSYRQQKVKSTAQMNLVIETLPRKMNSTTHRPNHRLQQFAYHSQQHNSQQYASTTGALQSATVQQPHQNIHNLTYVNTEALTSLPNVGMSTSVPSRSCSPLPPPPPSTPGAQSQNITPSMVLSYTPNHFQSPHHQQSFVHGRCMFAPFALNTSSAHAASSHAASPLTVGNMLCYTQLNDSGTLCDANQPTISVLTSINNDYDDSDSSSTNSVAFTQRRNNYQHVKSVSLSSSSSASSTSSSAARNFNATQQPVAVVAVPHLHSPDPSDFAYSTNFPASSQHYTTQPAPSPQQQQQSPFRGNGIISAFNVPLSNAYTDDDLNSIKQQQLKHQHLHHQQRHFYFASGEHLSAAPPSAHTGNGGYWSPLQHSNFLYPQPANLMASTPCLTPTATLSPCLSDHDDNYHHHHHIHNQQQLNIVTQSEVLPPVSHLKRSSSTQMGHSAIISQQTHQHHRLPQSTVSQGGSTVASLRQRSGGRIQLQGPQHLQTAAPQPAPTSISHVYPQHNLLYGGPQTHIRSLTNTSHEFFTHTPPDRFLARAHLIEAKEAPSSLLNNSKWDHLSQGVWNKFISSQQTEETYKQKMHLWRFLYIIIKNAYPRFGLYLVGSTISGFGADTSDVDMCLVSRSASSVEPRIEALYNLTVLRDYLSKSAEFENFNLIEAKVPILRFRHRIHQLEVDLNFNNCVGIKNTHLLYCYSQLDWRLRPMVLVTKLWAQYHNINNAKNMTISSYSLVLMVIHFLQYAVSPAVLPCLHELFPDKFHLLRSNDFGHVDMGESIGPFESKNTQTIGELFLYFLEYYSCFEYSQYAISIRTGGLLPINVCRLAKSSKNDIHHWKELCIEEPFDLTNTARSVYDFETFERVKAVFVASWRILQQTLDLNSIFSPIIIPISGSVVSTLNRTGLQYDDSCDRTSSETATRENSTIHATVNGPNMLLRQDTTTTHVSPAVTFISLPKDSSMHVMKEVMHNNTNGDDKTAAGSLSEHCLEIENDVSTKPFATGIAS